MPQRKTPATRKVAKGKRETEKSVSRKPSDPQNYQPVGLSVGNAPMGALLSLTAKGKVHNKTGAAALYFDALKRFVAKGDKTVGDWYKSVIRRDKAGKPIMQPRGYTIISHLRFDVGHDFVMVKCPSSGQPIRAADLSAR